MQHAEAGKDGLGAEPQRRRLAGMELRPRFPQDLEVVDRRAGLGQQRQRLGLGVEGVEGLRLAGRVPARGLFAGEHQREAETLIARAAFPAQIATADLEQPQPRRPAIEIAARSREQPRQ